MLSAPKSCRETGCGKPAVRGGQGWCATHEKANSTVESRRAFDRERADDEVRRMYGTVCWLGYRLFVLQRRPICQKLIHGVRCRNGATLVHHIISPRTRPDLFTDWDNTLALCADCHTPEASTPHWRRSVDYEYVPFEIPTVG